MNDTKEADFRRVWKCRMEYKNKIRKRLLMKSQKWIIVENIKRVTKVTEKENNMRTNYMMTVDDIMEE